MPQIDKPRKKPKVNRMRVSYTLNQITATLITDWAGEDRKFESHIIDDVVAFAAKNGFRDE